MSEERIYTSGWSDYELIDAGGGKKLERWGRIITIRPEVQAYFKSEKTFKEWSELAHWEFISKSGQTGEWKQLKVNAPHQWTISYDQLIFNLELTKFKHLGLFPEQRINWDHIKDQLNSEEKFLNLFAYTGAASCIAKNTGAEIIHVDSVKQLIAWAAKNMESSQLNNIKWVLEDALKFALREQKRKNKYQGIIMDPPAYGHGVKGEKWILEDKIDELLAVSATLLDEEGFLIMNTYSPRLDRTTVQSLAKKYFPQRKFEVKELWMKSTTGKDLYYGNLLRVS
jgi:23S rRNA (cytosine1962-C5)-methyltransferase